MSKQQSSPFLPGAGGANTTGGNASNPKHSRSIAEISNSQQKTYANVSTPNRATSGTIQSTSQVRKSVGQPVMLSGNGSATNLNSKYNYDYGGGSGMPQNANSGMGPHVGFGSHLTKSPMTEGKANYHALGRANQYGGETPVTQNRIRESLSGDPVMRNRSGLAGNNPLKVGGPNNSLTLQTPSLITSSGKIISSQNTATPPPNGSANTNALIEQMLMKSQLQQQALAQVPNPLLGVNPAQLSSQSQQLLQFLLLQQQQQQLQQTPQQQQPIINRPQQILPAPNGGTANQDPVLQYIQMLQAQAQAQLQQQHHQAQVNQQAHQMALQQQAALYQQLLHLQQPASQIANQGPQIQTQHQTLGMEQLRSPQGATQTQGVSMTAAQLGFQEQILLQLQQSQHERSGANRNAGLSGSMVGAHSQPGTLPRSFSNNLEANPGGIIHHQPAMMKTLQDQFSSYEQQQETINTFRAPGTFQVAQAPAQQQVHHQPSHHPGRPSSIAFPPQLSSDGNDDSCSFLFEGSSFVTQATHPLMMQTSQVNFGDTLQKIKDVPKFVQTPKGTSSFTPQQNNSASKDQLHQRQIPSSGQPPRAGAAPATDGLRPHQEDGRQSQTQEIGKRKDSNPSHTQSLEHGAAISKGGSQGSAHSSQVVTMRGSIVTQKGDQAPVKQVPSAPTRQDVNQESHNQVKYSSKVTKQTSIDLVHEQPQQSKQQSFDEQLTVRLKEEEEQRRRQDATKKKVQTTKDASYKQPVAKPPQKKQETPLEPGMIELDPALIYFTFSRVRPFFSCGRPVQETLESLLQGDLSTADLPSITLLFDGKHYFSLNNRRLFVFKTLRAAGKLQTIRARIKQVPQTKRMKDKYTIEKCSLTAKLMREGGAGGVGLADEEPQDDDDLLSDREESPQQAKKKGKGKKGKQSDNESDHEPLSAKRGGKKAKGKPAKQQQEKGTKQESDESDKEPKQGDNKAKPKGKQAAKPQQPTTKSSVFSRFQAPSSSSSDKEEDKVSDIEEEKEEDLALQQPVKDLNPDPHATPQPLPASLLTLEEDVANDDTEDLDTKLAELDREIERFREQNRHLEGVQRECEVALDKVNREIREFERRKERETKDFEGWMNRERGQIQMERDEVGQQREDVERDRESIRFEREELEIIKDQLNKRENDMSLKLRELEIQNEVLHSALQELSSKHADQQCDQQTFTEVEDQPRSRKTLVDQETSPHPLNLNRHELLRVSQVRENSVRVISIESATPRTSYTGLNDLNEELKQNDDRSVVSFGLRLSRVDQEGLQTHRDDHPHELTVQRDHQRLLTTTGLVNVIESTSQQPLTVTQESQDQVYSTNSPAKNLVSASPVKTVLMSSLRNRRRMRGLSPTKDAIKEFSCDDTSDCGGPLEESGIIDEEEETFELRLDEHPYRVDRAVAMVVEEQTTAEGKVHKRYSDGRREIIFQNGVRREIWEDGYSVVYFSNGDLKQTFPASNRRGQRIVYFYADARTTQTTYPNGLQVYRFSNNQVEKHFPDGTKEIQFPDGTLKCVFPETGEEESIFPDGTIQRSNKQTGITIIEFPNGARETLYADGRKVRELADGTVVNLVTPISQRSNPMLNTNQTVIDEDENEDNTSSVFIQRERMREENREPSNNNSQTPRDFEIENAPSDK